MRHWISPLTGSAPAARRTRRPEAAQPAEILEARRLLAAGDLDTTFSGDGKVNTQVGLVSPATQLPLNPSVPGVQAVLQQDDGKIIAVGAGMGIGVGINQDLAAADQMSLTRYNSNGSLDTSFGPLGTGTVVHAPQNALGTIPYAAALTTVGGVQKILVAGTLFQGLAVSQAAYSGFVARYNLDGTLDTTFGNAGIAFSGTMSRMTDLVVDPPTGDVIVVGTSLFEEDVFIERFDDGGNFVSGGDGEGRATAGTDVDVVRQSDGKFVVATTTVGGTSNILRYNANLSLDTTFGRYNTGAYDLVLPNGNPETITDLAIQSDDKVVIVGNIINPVTNSDWFIARISPTAPGFVGDLDPTFSGDGFTAFAFGTTSALDQHLTSVTLQSNGRIILAGSRTNSNTTRDMMVGRLLTDGAADSSFGSAGFSTLTFGSTDDAAFSVAVQSDNKILAGGVLRVSSNQSLDWAVARLDGSVSNLAPVLGGNGAAQTWNETDPSPKRYIPSASVTDSDSPDFNGGVLTAQIITNAQPQDLLAVRNEGNAAGQVGVSGNTVSYGGVAIGTLAGGVGANALTVTFNSATATPTAVRQVMRNLTFRNTSDNPTNATRTVRLTLSDGDGGTSAPITQQVAVNPSNDGPALSGISGSVGWTEGTAAAFIGGGAVLTDVDSPDLNGGQVTVNISVNGMTTDRIEIKNQGTAAGQIGVSSGSVSFGGTVFGTFPTAGTGTVPLVVTLNANATAAAVQALLRRLTYRNTNDNPTNKVRTIQYTVTDGDGGTSATPTRNVNVTPVNDAPVVTAPAAPATTYTLAGPAVVVSSNATVADADSSNFNTGNLTVSISANNLATDALAIRNQGTGAGQIGVNGANVTFAGGVIGTFTGGNGTNPLVVTFTTGAATKAAVQALVQNVTYASSAGTASPATRTIQFVVNDGDGGAATSVAVTKTVTLSAAFAGARATQAPQTAGGVDPSAFALFEGRAADMTRADSSQATSPFSNAAALPAEVRLARVLTVAGIWAAFRKLLVS